jgi:hypothetical protein
MKMHSHAARARQRYAPYYHSFIYTRTTRIITRMRCAVHLIVNATNVRQRRSEKKFWVKTWIRMNAIDLLSRSIWSRWLKIDFGCKVEKLSRISTRNRLLIDQNRLIRRWNSVTFDSMESYRPTIDVDFASIDSSWKYKLPLKNYQRDKCLTSMCSRTWMVTGDYWCHWLRMRMLDNSTSRWWYWIIILRGLLIKQENLLMLW